MSPATGRSISAQLRGSPVISPEWWSHFVSGPWVACTKRTPDSENRRARRQRSPKSPATRVVEAVEPPGGLGLALDAHQFGRLGLHAERELVRFDAALQREVGSRRCELAALPALQQVDLGALHGGADRLVLEEVDGGLGGVHPRVADRGAVVGGGEERGRVVLHAAVLVRRTDGDEGGQVLVLGAEPVRDPRPHRGPHEAVAARVHREDGAAVGRRWCRTSSARSRCRRRPRPGWAAARSPSGPTARAA